MSINATGPGADDRIGHGASAVTPKAIESGDREPLRAPFPRPGFGVRRNPKEGASIGSLVADMPRLFIQLAKDELEHVKREVMGKAQKLGVGAGLFGAAGFFALTMWAVLVTAAILGLNEVFAPWLSALIVAGVLLVFAVLLALVGYASVKRGMPVTPEDSINSVKQDLNAVKGLGQYE